MNIIHVVRQFLPSIGGLEDVVHQLGREHLRRGLGPVRVVTLDRLFRGGEGRLPAHEFIDGIEVIRLPHRGSSRYPLCPTVLAQLGGADLVHVHGIDFFFDYLAATRWWHRRPLVASTHGGFFHTPYASGLKQVYFRTVTRASAHAYGAIVATSHSDGEMFADVVSPRRLRVVENGVDVQRYAGAARGPLGRQLLYFGRWSVNKGLPQALALLKALRDQHPGWSLTVAGREYDLSADGLMQQARRLGVAEHLQLVPNPSIEVLRELMTVSSYFVSLSRHEGFGLTAIEALSAGLIPILSAIPAYERVIEGVGLGYLCPSDPAEAARLVEDGHAGLAGSIEQQRAKAIGFCSAFAWDKVFRKYEGIYEEVCGKGGP